MQNKRKFPNTIAFFSIFAVNLRGCLSVVLDSEKRGIKMDALGTRERGSKVAE
jgi:hypothetical protein